jgi:hypothetical protein
LVCGVGASASVGAGACAGAAVVLAWLTLYAVWHMTLTLTLVHR